jgi:hypothetical protein
VLLVGLVVVMRSLGVFWRLSPIHVQNHPADATRLLRLNGIRVNGEMVQRLHERLFCWGLALFQSPIEPGRTFAPGIRPKRQTTYAKCNESPYRTVAVAVY